MWFLPPVRRWMVPPSSVFGHTHAPFSERMGNVLLFNPGSAGESRNRGRRSVGILHCDDLGIGTTHIDL